jgi:NADH:ubiquinone oxidoreductase subunit E
VVEIEGFLGSQEFNDEPIDDVVWQWIDAYLKEYPGGQERLIPVLHGIQERLSYIPFAVQEYVAERLDLSPAQVAGVVSFYHFFSTTPRGRHQFKVCAGTACFVRRGGQVAEAIREDLGIVEGGVTDDRLFSLDKVRCIGACGLAPAVMVNNDVYGNMNSGEASKLIRDLKAQTEEQPCPPESVGDKDDC